jgi:hypothetical protein
MMSQAQINQRSHVGQNGVDFRAIFQILRSHRIARIKSIKKFFPVLYSINSGYLLYEKNIRGLVAL